MSIRPIIRVSSTSPAPRIAQKPGSGGTDFFRHKRTGLERVPANGAELAASGYDTLDALVEDVVNRDTTQPARWERVMRVPMRFQPARAILALAIPHLRSGFGTDDENARLVMLLFFGRAAG